MPKDSPFSVNGINRHEISRPAIEATRALCTYYDISVPGSEPVELSDAEKKASAHDNLLDIAKMIDVTTSVFRCLKWQRIIVHRQQQILAGNLSPDEVAAFLRELGVQFARLPSYGSQEEETKLLTA